MANPRAFVSFDYDHDVIKGSNLLLSLAMKDERVKSPFDSFDFLTGLQV